MTTSRRYRELALLLPLAALLLFMPPYLRILSRADQLLGIPVLHIYIFGIWFAGILLTAAISRRLVRDLAIGEDDGFDEAGDRGSGPP